MGDNGDLLPQGFEFLEQFSAKWAQLTTTAERYLCRQDTDFSELKTFYEAMAPRIDDVFNHLDQYSVDDFPAREQALYNLALGLTEVAEAVEFFGQSRMKGAPYPHILETHSFNYN